MPKFCTTCGKQLPFEEAEICPGCGVRLRASSAAQPGAGSANKGLLMGIAILGVIFVVVLIGAAVIAAFVYGTSGNIQATKAVSATAYGQGSNIVITYQGGQDAPLVSKLTYGTGSLDHVWYSPMVGDKRSLTRTSSGNDHVMVAATFTDGYEQIILDTYI